MSKNFEITVMADENLDDCLAGAAEAYIEENPDLEGYDLSPRWTDDSRETVTLTVPGWHYGWLVEQALTEESKSA